MKIRLFLSFALFALLFSSAALVAQAQKKGKTKKEPAPAAASQKGKAGHKGKGGHHGHGGKESNFTLKEVMQHLAAAEQEIQTGLLMNNRLMVKKGAKAIAHHPMPKGGIKPYLKKNHQEFTKVVKTMDKNVHQSAVEMAKVADTASMLDLQALNNKMTSGCIGCHNVFRD
jgi:hypothetical protein